MFAVVSLPLDRSPSLTRDPSRRAAHRTSSGAGRIRRRSRLHARPGVDLMEDRTLLSALITADKGDYAPGATAIISGSGWQAGEAVKMDVFNLTTRTDETQWTTSADADGNVSTSLIVGNWAGDTLQLTATGAGDHQVATTTFTDAIGTPTSIATGANITPNSSFTSGTFSSSVAVGNTIVVAVAMDPNSATTVIVGDGHNNYTLNADVTQGSGTTGVRTVIFSAPVKTALTTSDSITVTFDTNVQYKCVDVLSVSGLVVASPTDQSHTGTGVNTSPNSGSTGTTSQADELLIGAIGVGDSTAFHAGGSYTALDGVTIGVGHPAIHTEFQIVGATSAYSATGTLDTGQPWAAAIVTYKAVLPTTTSVALTTGTSPSTYGDSLTFTATVTNTLHGAPTGTVEFYDGATDLGPGTALSHSGANAATSTFIISTLNAAVHSHIHAVYTATGSFVGSTSPDVSQTVNQRAVILSGSRTYDGTMTAGYGILSIANKVPGDSISLTAGSVTLASMHAGNPAITSTSGLTLGGTAAANYTLTGVTGSVAIAARPVDLSGSRVYDGSTTADSTILTIDNVLPGDTVFIASGSAALAGKDVGAQPITDASGLTLGGPAPNDYTVIDATGSVAISRRPITVTAITYSKTYDGTTSAAPTPTITAGTLAVGDAGSFFETYDTKNAGTGKTLAPDGAIIGPGVANVTGDYNVTFVPVTTGAIVQRDLTVTALTSTKTYDGTTGGAATPTITSGSLATGDTANFSEVYAGKNVGTGLALTPGGVVNDGNSGNNYVYTFVPVSTGIITPRALGVTADSTTKAYGTTLTFAGTEFTTSGLVAGDSITSVALASAGAPASAARGDYPIVASSAVGTGLSNYDISYVPGTLTVAGAATMTVLVTAGGSSVFGQPVSFTAQVAASTPGAAAPTGAVALLVDNQSIGAAVLDSSGKATLNTTALAVGGHSVVAVYLGSDAASGSQSGPISWQVNQAGTSSLLTVSRHGNKIWLTAPVGAVAPGSGSPGGLVSFFRANGQQKGTVALSGNSATLILSRKYALNKRFWARYNGSPSFLSSETVRKQVTERSMALPSLAGAARTAMARLSDVVLGVLPSFTDKKAR